MVAVWSAVTRFYIENHDPVTYAPELQHLKRPHNQKWWYYVNPYYSKWRHPYP